MTGHNVMRREKIVVVCFFILILFGILLRFYNLRLNTPFNWDQENSVAFPAYEILVNHKLPLIGAKTGVGDLFLNPFYTYAVTPFFALFGMDPIAGAVSSGVFAVVTIVAGYLLLRDLVGEQASRMFALLWSVSPLVVSLDRIPWNVNLFPLATLLIFVGLWQLLEQGGTVGWILVGLGLFVGFTAHLSVLFLIVYVILVAFLYKRVRNGGAVIAIMFVCAAILPLVVFNIRHDNILLNNLASFATDVPTTANKLIPRFIEIFQLSLKTIGSVGVGEGNTGLSKIIGVLFISVLLLYRKHPVLKRYVSLFGILFATYLLGLGIYSGNVPEYYMIGLTTVAVVGMGIILGQLVHRNRILMLVVVYAAFLFAQSAQQATLVNPHSLGVKSDVVGVIKTHAEGKPVNVVYDMDLGWSFGYEYLFKHAGISHQRATAQATGAYWLSYPRVRFPANPDAVVHNFAIGYPATTDKILQSKDITFYRSLFSMRIPKSWVVLSCPAIDFDTYVLSADSDTSCIKAQQDILILNSPNCRLEDFENSGNLVELPNGLQLIEIKATQFSQYRGDSTGNAYIASFEKDRCIGFIEPAHGDITVPEFLSMLATIRSRQP